MQEFFETIDDVKVDICFLSVTTKEINLVKEQTLGLSGSRGRDNNTGRLAVLVLKANKVAVKNKMVLQALRKEVADIELDMEKDEAYRRGGKKKKKKKKRAADSQKSRTVRVRKNVVQAVTRKFIGIMKEYQEAQQAYKCNIEDTTLRQVQIVSPDVTRQDLQGIIRQQGDGAREVVASIATQSLLQSKVNGETMVIGRKIKNALKGVESRYNEVIFLEASIRELAGMFEEFAMMVEEQSELLDNIEFQTRAAKEFIDDGLLDTQEAIHLNRKLRKKRCCMLMIVLLLVVFALLIFKIE